MLVEDLLHYSPLRLISTAPDSLISDTVQRMAQYNIGLIVVIDDDDKIAGVLSERDIVKGLADTETDIEEAIVADLMTTGVITVSPTDTLADAVIIMNTHGIRHLLVVQANKPVGVLSVRDALRVVAKQLEEAQSGAEDGERNPDLLPTLAAG